MRSLLRTLLGAATMLVAGHVSAQAPTDYPNLKGSSLRQGTNGDPANSSPGRLVRTTGTVVVGGVTVQNGSLRWIQPMNSGTPVGSLRTNEVNPFDAVIDNTDTGAATHTDSSGNNVGPYDPNDTGGITFVGTWGSPQEQDEAIFSYVPVRRRNVVGGNGADPNPRWPAYNYASSVASAPGSDPRVRYATALPDNQAKWTFLPKVNSTTTPPFTVSTDPSFHDYGISVHIPEGQTTVAGVQIPRQRFFVFNIRYTTSDGITHDYVDVVDTNLTSGNWVRLGNGGRATNRVFPGGAGNPIEVTLYNTIPRDANGNLTETVTNPNAVQPRLVYADAVRFTRDTRSILATPTQAGFIVGATDIRTVSAYNETSTIANGQTTGLFEVPPQTTAGVVSSYVHNTGAPLWSYQLDGNGATTRSFEDTTTAFTASGGFVADSTNAYRFLGTRLLVAPIVAGAATENVVVDPAAGLPDGDYAVEMYVGGRTGQVTAANPLATAVQYEIFEGGVSAGVFTLNERAGEPGYRRLGDRRYRHTAANRLTVQFYNSSGNATADAGSSVTVDAFRFVVPSNNAIVSTPVQATALIRQSVGGVPVPTNVILVADERGRIHCLDATGNTATGQTTTYWVYPSYTETGLKDPNNDATAGGINPVRDGVNGETEASMPPYFDLSTAVIRRLTVIEAGVPVLRDYLYIGAANGRVYSIAMEGRGDADTTVGQPGTTFRRWTYPSTYPATEQVSRLGKIASVVAGTVGGTETIYAATESGRIYALDALGGSTNVFGDAGLTAGTPRWQYPAANAATLGSMEGAPALDAVGNRLFVPVNASDTSPGQVLCVNATTGTLTWSFGPNNAALEPVALDFRSGPAFVSATELNDLTFVPALPAPDMVFAMNENGYIYGIDATTGLELWRTNELLSGGRGSLGYMRISTYGSTGVLGAYPAITVPTENGHIAAMFARPADTTQFGNRRVFGVQVESPVTASIAVGNRWMYGASEGGYLYAFSDPANAGGSLPGDFFSTVIEDVVDNDPDPTIAAFRNAEVGLLSRQGFVSLRQTQPGTITGTQNFSDVIDSAATWTSPDGRIKSPFRSGRTSPVFEWGETIYVMVYNFPATQVDTAGQTIAPPVVEATITTEGKAGRPIVSEARIFKDRTNADPDGGYAIVQVPLTAGGQTSLPPGPGTIQVSIRTSAGNRTFVPQSITLNPARTRLSYRVAHPLGLAMVLPGGTGQTAYTLGYTADAANADNAGNGVSQFDASILGRNPALLGTSYGVGFHGNTRSVRMYVYDRSLMTLLRGEGRGLDNVRLERRDLNWEGGAASVVKGMGAAYGALFSGFNRMEDLPTATPNISLDYPDIRRERVSATKDPDGNAENPLFNGVALKGPRDASGNPVTEATALSRLLVPTTFELKLDIPRFQPPAFVPTLSQVPDSAGNFLPQGYAGRVNVFVDADGSGTVNMAREAFRGFNAFASVAPDERLIVTTPSLDLGALSSGAGYDSTLTYSNVAPYRTMGPANSTVSPWTGTYTGMFKPFSAINEGNVNLLDVRLAKQTRDDTGSTPVIYPWQVFSPANDSASAWLDGSLDVWSDLDVAFAPEWAVGRNEVVAPKPRVTDVAGRAIRANPEARFNPNVAGADGTPLIAGFPSRDPRIAVTLPLGFPVGAYAQTFRLIEDFRSGTPTTNNDETLSLSYAANGQVDPVESYSDPGLKLSFTAVETPLTGTRSNYVAEQVDAGSVRTATDAQNDVAAGRDTTWASRQPAAIRSANGAMALVFASNRRDTTGAFSWLPDRNATPSEGSTYRLWIAGLAGNNPGSPRVNRAPDSQTRDLNKFKPANTDRFWQQSVGAYPSGTAASLFPAGTLGGTAIEGSQTFGVPALPSAGFADPLTYGDPAATPFTEVTLAFVGNVLRSTSSGNVTDSRLFATSLSLAQNGAPVVGTPVALDFAPDATKGRPAVVQSTAPTGGGGSTIVFPATSNGVSTLYFTRFNGTSFTKPFSMNLGNAFESAGEPSATIRDFAGTPVLELAFTGRLRGRAGSEVFLMNLLLGPDHLPLQPLQYVFFNVTGERPSFDERSGTYRVRGAFLREPQGQPPVAAGLYDDFVALRSAPAVDVRTAASRKIDRESRIESSTSATLGGQIYTDRGAGTIRVVGSALPRTQELLVSYQSAILRVSQNDGAGYGTPNIIQDSRLAPSNSSATFADQYWFTPSGAICGPNDATYADRTYLMYTRSAQAGGQTTRPFASSYRFGVRIGRVIATNANGSLTEPVTVAGATGNYQVDPAGGRVYFTRADEGKNVTVTVGTGVNQVVVAGPIGIVGERAEAPVPLGRAQNEANLFAFLDPVFSQTPRRGLVWMFWSSTRNGSPNIFFQSVSPQLGPTVPSP